MAADWSQPTIGTPYATLLAALLARDVDSATLYQAAGTATNVPDKAVRWNPATNSFEQYSLAGGTWSQMMANGLAVPSVTVANAPTTAAHATRKDYVDGQVTAVSTVANAALPRSGGTMNGSLYVQSGGTTNGFENGNGDAASYGTYNFAMRGWNGMGMRSFDNTINGYYDFRAGKWDTKGGFYVNGVRTWDYTNFNPANYIPTWGGSITGQLTMANSQSLALQGTGYTGYMRGDQAGLVGFINQAQNAWNFQITDGGNVNARGVVYAGGSGGAYLNTDGNIWGTAWGGWLSNSIAAKANAWHSGWGNSGYVVTDTSNIAKINWDGSNTLLYIDSTYQGALINHNNYGSWCAPRSIMDQGGVGSYAIRGTVSSYDTPNKASDSGWSAYAGGWRAQDQVNVGGNNTQYVRLWQRTS
jgi:hypothetical protein